MLKFIITVPLLFQILVQTECLFSGDTCYAEDQQGSCVPLQQCRPLVDEIRRAGNPMPACIRKKLQGLACGFDLHEPVVCCVSSGNDHQKPNLDTHFPGGANIDTDRPNHNTDGLNFVGSGEQNNDNNVEAFTRGTEENKNGPPNVEDHPNLGLLPTQCGNIESYKIIWGGNRTKLFEMPWMVLLSYYDSDRGPKLSCGGTIINQWYVLTAAHCVSFLSARMRLNGVIVGEYDIRQDPDCETADSEKYCAPSVMNVTVDSVITHPGYAPSTLFDDIALIRLAQPANLNLDSVKPLCLPITRALQRQSLEGLSGVVAGWGAKEDWLQSPVLLSVEVPMISPGDCQEAYNGFLNIYNSQLCAGGEKDKDSCGGDSGGPLMYPGTFGSLGPALRYIQRGIVSFGLKRCGSAGYPSVYTNVAYYMDWILDNIRS